MTTEDLMKLRELAAIVYSGCCTAKAVDEYRELTNPAKVIALLDALEAQGREVARLREVNAEQYGALDLAARECTTLRAELAAIRAQEPVIDFTVLHQFASDQAISHNKLCTAVRMAVASPAAKDAGLVADGCLWTQDSHFEMGDTYDSACGEKWSFVDGGPEESNVRFCQGCGRPVKLATSPKLGGV